MSYLVILLDLIILTAYQQHNEYNLEGEGQNIFLQYCALLSIEFVDYFSYTVQTLWVEPETFLMSYKLCTHSVHSVCSITGPYFLADDFQYFCNVAYFCIKWLLCFIFPKSGQKFNIWVQLIFGACMDRLKIHHRELTATHVSFYTPVHPKTIADRMATRSSPLQRK
jgi:hypothetical protein